METVLPTHAATPTQQRVDLRERMTKALAADAAAADRNHQLLNDMTRMSAILRTTRKHAADARAQQRHEESRKEQEGALADLRRSLGEIQARRERA